MAVDRPFLPNILNMADVLPDQPKQVEDPKQVADRIIKDLDNDLNDIRNKIIPSTRSFKAFDQRGFGSVFQDAVIRLSGIQADIDSVKSKVIRLAEDINPIDDFRKI